MNNNGRDLQEDLMEEFANYDSGYICDIITEIADNNIDIYNKNLLDDA